MIDLLPEHTVLTHHSVNNLNSNSSPSPAPLVLPLSLLTLQPGRHPSSADPQATVCSTVHLYPNPWYNPHSRSGKTRYSPTGTYPSPFPSLCPCPVHVPIPSVGPVDQTASPCPARTCVCDLGNGPGSTVLVERNRGWRGVGLCPLACICRPFVLGEGRRKVKGG